LFGEGITTQTEGKKLGESKRVCWVDQFFGKRIVAEKQKRGSLVEK